MHSTKIELHHINIGHPDEDQLAAGHPAEVAITFAEAMVLPIPGPDGGPIVGINALYTGTVDGETAVQLGKQLIEAGEKMPKASRLEVANDLSAVENAAKRMEDLRNGR